MRCLTNSSANQKHRQGIHEAWLDRELVLGFTWTGVIQVLLSTPVQFWIGARFYVGAWKALTHGSANMDVLVVLGTSAAYFYSLVVMVLAAFRDGFEAHLFFETAVFLIVFIVLGKFLEVLGKGSAFQDFLGRFVADLVNVAGRWRREVIACSAGEVSQLRCGVFSCPPLSVLQLVRDHDLTNFYY